MNWEAGERKHPQNCTICASLWESLFNLFISLSLSLSRALSEDASTCVEWRVRDRGNQKCRTRNMGRGGETDGQPPKAKEAAAQTRRSSTAASSWALLLQQWARCVWRRGGGRRRANDKCIKRSPQPQNCNVASCKDALMLQLMGDCYCCYCYFVTVRRSGRPERSGDHQTDLTKNATEEELVLLPPPPPLLSSIL